MKGRRIEKRETGLYPVQKIYEKIIKNMVYTTQYTLYTQFETGLYPV